MKKEFRIVWVDIVKCIACLIVLLGHLIQSMLRAEIMSENDGIYCTLRAFYHVNVPLFLICSGYLYQKNRKINSAISWMLNIRSKLKCLGIPYLVFVLAVWTIKVIFHKYVNIQPGRLIEALILEPISPYWFLLCLLLIFLITITFNNCGIAIMYNIVALGLYIISELEPVELPYMVDTLFCYMIWFIIGMDFCYFRIVERIRVNSMLIAIGIIGQVLFIISNAVYSLKNVSSIVLYFLISILGCIDIVIIAVCISQYCSDGVLKVIHKSAEYTWPIFLLHTIFAAGIRITLSLFGVDNLWIHMISGVVVGIATPIIAYDAYRLVVKNVNTRRKRV